jgi:small-conductance mechanosensitive channel
VPPPKGVEVKLRDSVAFVLRVPHGTQTAEQRARDASAALESAIDDSGADEVRVESRPGVAVVYVGKTPIVQLYPEDAQAAGDSSLEVHAAAIETKVSEAIREELKRSAIATRVFSFSAVVVAGLVAFWIIRKIGSLTGRARDWISDHPERIPAIRLQSLEVVRPATLRWGVLLALGLGKWLAQFTIAYAWLVLALSLFASTRAYTEQLTGLVFAPISALMGRIATTLPLILVAAMAAVAVAILLRFISLFFISLERGETTVAGLPRDLARPTSLLLRIGVVVAALVFAAPVVTGDSEGALTRSGAIAIVALALAGTPLLASAVVGIPLIYLRRLRVGQIAEIGGASGRVVEIGFFDVRLQDAEGCEVRVPHLLSLVRPTRLLGPLPRVSVEISVVAGASQPRVRELLQQTASAFGEQSGAELVGIDAEGAHYRVWTLVDRPDARGELRLALADALARANVALGRSRAS